jgi:hypothetical protein
MLGFSYVKSAASALGVGLIVGCLPLTTAAAAKNSAPQGPFNTASAYLDFSRIRSSPANRRMGAPATTG